MRTIFDTFQNTPLPLSSKQESGASKNLTSGRIVKRERPPQSTSEIREKLELRRSKEGTIKSSTSTKLQDQPTGDVAVNDPKDPMTSEKLKSLLTTGAFNFSEKERQALGEILNK